MLTDTQRHKFKELRAYYYAMTPQGEYEERMAKAEVGPNGTRCFMSGPYSPDDRMRQIQVHMAATFFVQVLDIALLATEPDPK